MNNELLSPGRVAELLGIKPQTLRSWRHLGKGPRYVRIGGPRGRVMYEAAAIVEWIAAHTFANTSEESAHAAQVVRLAERHKALRAPAVPCRAAQQVAGGAA
jgi:predicted DNA-binding transcriptional regulator AlpA